MSDVATHLRGQAQSERIKAARAARKAGRLTPRQVECLEAIGELQRKLGYPPSIRELAERLGTKSLNSIHIFLGALEDGGYVARELCGPRTLRVLKNADGTPACCPACGRAA